VSLIFIRRFFKDIAELDDMGKLTQFTHDIRTVFLDVGAGLVMFLLVFLHAGLKRTPPDAWPQLSAELKKFISRKSRSRWGSPPSGFARRLRIWFRGLERDLSHSAGETRSEYVFLDRSL
jgi:hypothetical protein